MGFWAALEEIYPDTRQQRCWMHKTGNVLNCLPKSMQPKAKQALHDIWQADTRGNAEKAFELFVKTYEAKYPKATLMPAKRCLKEIELKLAYLVDFETAQHSNRVMRTIRHP